MDDGITSITENDFVDPPSEIDFKPERYDSVMKELAWQVNNIAIEEREAGLYDMHGVTVTLEESPEALDMSVGEMNSILTRKIDWRQASAFKLAESQSIAYTRDKKLLVMFLRCEKYNAEAAVTRLLAFFQHKLRLFGHEKLCKEAITQADLNAEDMESLAAGYFQLLPHRDHAGRALFVYLPRFAKWVNHDNALRLIYYLCMAALKDKETQKKGAVVIVHCHGEVESNPKQNDSILSWKSMQLMRSVLPINFVGHHICTSPSSFLRFFFSHISKFIGTGGIIRTRFHEGTFEEVDQQLAGFGIQGIHLAISYPGDLKVDKHKELLRMLKSWESAKSTSPEEEHVILPTQTDVLLGRGKPIQNHPGNIRLGLIVQSLLQNYDDSAKRQEKTQLAAETAEKMKEAGVRFLTKVNGGWVVASDKLARERVSSTFRTVRDRLKLSQESNPRANEEAAGKGKRPHGEMDNRY